MKKFIAAVILFGGTLGGSTLVWSSEASAAVPSACQAGSRSACRTYVVNTCVTRVKAYGFTDAAARAACS
jgi:hypothetical protein